MTIAINSVFLELLPYVNRVGYSSLVSHISHTGVTTTLPN